MYGMFMIAYECNWQQTQWKYGRGVEDGGLGEQASQWVQKESPYHLQNWEASLSSFVQVSVWGNTLHLPMSPTPSCTSQAIDGFSRLIWKSCPFKCPEVFKPLHRFVRLCPVVDLRDSYLASSQTFSLHFSLQFCLVCLQHVPFICSVPL